MKHRSGTAILFCVLTLAACDDIRWRRAGHAIVQRIVQLLFRGARARITDVAARVCFTHRLQVGEP